jgi:hypothetical protein
MDILKMTTKLKVFISLAAAIVVFSVTSCKTEEVATFTTPSTYRFNSPTVVDKAYYVRTSTNDYKKVTDTLEDFVVDNEDLADSINVKLLGLFEKQAITSIAFINGTDAKITFARYDRLAKNFVNIVEEPSKYSLVGNKIVFDILPAVDIEINNFFLELRQCYQACDRVAGVRRKFPLKDTLVQRSFDLRQCQFTKDIDYIGELQPTIGAIDTVAIYDLDVVFSKY